MKSENLLNGNYMVFDVESIGLHGEGFAVGFVVVNLTDNGLIMDSGRYVCPLFTAKGHPDGRAWVKTNCPKMKKTHDNPKQVRSAFWKKWKEWKGKNALLVADCCWPVEARFLAKCVDDEPTEREWTGPYPLHDIASLLLANGKDPLEMRVRQPDQLPEHDPLADAKQSAQIMLGLLKVNRVGDWGFKDAEAYPT